LPGWKIEPNMVTRPPVQPPVATVSRRKSSKPGENRWVKKITEATSCPATADTTSSAAATVSASGLSSSRCFPARAARAASPACTSGGSATAIASTSASSASTSRYGRTPYRSASAAAFAGSRPHTPASVASGCAASPAACTSAAQ
jgi:hypothetical protein